MEYICTQSFLSESCFKHILDKKMKKYLASALAAVAVATLAGCSSVDLDKDKDGVNAANGDWTAIQNAINDPNGPLAKKEVYFDFDSYTVSPQYMPVVTNHAKFLASNPALRVTLEGNTDERGGREYNLALGQKRAEAVKQRMTLLGVNPDQIEAVSFGKEKPRAEGSNEAAWAENRRVDIRYVLPTP
jgi:peptidoglycan-associated lipoprotein